MTGVSSSGKRPDRHLWMVNHYAITPDLPGGSRHFELASCLRAFGWSTTVFATPFNYNTSEFLRDVSVFRPFLSETVEDVQFRWLYSLPYRRNDWRRYGNMLSFALGLLPAGFRQHQPSVILGSSPHPLAALSAWVLARMRRVPFVLEVRDLWPDTLVEMGLDSPIVIKPLSYIERLLYRNADVIFALTEGIAQGIQAKGVPSEKVVFLPNAVLRPSPVDPVDRQRVRRDLGWKDEVVAVYAGAHGPANALDQVVDAVRDLPESANVRMVFIGDGPTKAELVRRAAGLSRVTFMDPVPKEEIAPILRAADIGILSLRQTSVFEGARPNKLFDYMSNGLPVITTIGGEASRVLSEAEAGVFAPSEKLSSALSQMADHPEQRKAMGSAGLGYVGNTLTREDTAEILADQLERFIRHKK